jgi:hypothetical protein
LLKFETMRLRALAIAFLIGGASSIVYAAPRSQPTPDTATTRASSDMPTFDRGVAQARAQAAAIMHHRARTTGDVRASLGLLALVYGAVLALVFALFRRSPRVTRPMLRVSRRRSSRPASVMS